MVAKNVVVFEEPAIDFFSLCLTFCKPQIGEAEALKVDSCFKVVNNSQLSGVEA